MTAQVLVVGAVNVDVVSTDELPGPGQTVVGASAERYGGGKGANAAVAAAGAGAEVRYCGAVGRDDAGSGAVAELRTEGIDVTDVATLDGVSTGTALIVVDRKGEASGPCSPPTPPSSANCARCWGSTGRCGFGHGG
jgi:ribokinase